MSSEEKWSDLQVVPESFPEPVQAEKYLAFHTTELSYEAQSQMSDRTKHEAADSVPPPPPRIWGMSRKVFYIVLSGIAILGIVAAVVGGVVASRATQREPPPAAASNMATSTTQGADASQTSAISSPATSVASKPESATPTSSDALTRTTAIQGTKTLVRDCPSSNETVYQALGSAQYQFRKQCEVRIIGNGKTYVNEPVGSLDECIERCTEYNVANKKDIASGDKKMCNAVCWRHSLGSDLPGQCFGTLTTNVTTGWNLEQGRVECDSAGWINPPTTSGVPGV